MNKSKSTIKIFENAMETIIKGEIIPDKDVLRFMKLDKNTLIRTGLKFISKKSSGLTEESARILNLNLQQIHRCAKLNFFIYKNGEPYLVTRVTDSISSLRLIPELYNLGKEIPVKDISQALTLNKDTVIEIMFDFIFDTFSHSKDFEKEKEIEMIFNYLLCNEKVNHVFHFGDKTEFRDQENIKYLLSEEYKRRK